MMFFLSKDKLKDTGIVRVKYFPCIYLAFHINSSYFLKIVCWDDVFFNHLYCVAMRTSHRYH